MLANLATATASDRQAVAELSISNATLTHEFRSATVYLRIRSEERRVEVQENEFRMKQPISTETLFEEFVEKIETAVDVVPTQVPYTRHHIVSIAFTMVENARIYYDGIKEWR